MGIYSNGKIYGISLFLNENEIFKKIYSQEMTSSQIKNALDEYNLLKNNKSNVIINIYSPCSSTYNGLPNISMSWFPANKEILENAIQNL